ncbi:MAG: c-type cytochrome [Cytophagaceae bacterium]|nr:c-type cytochrome [Cytophagaceae bacterium]MBK9935205.1 c-type cytochrome [Cytophagaceae bacterium]MBL0301648.1 c-type cytochrome [Cytophagaceae bacterium]MBL0324473.1 c-type cytochrome [Cytophagaceae bacterium]
MINNISKKLLSFIIVFSSFQVSLMAQDGDAAAGETLFKNNCAQCHATDASVIVGPGMSGIEDRRDFAWIKTWINNPAAVISSGDKYAVELYEKYNKTQMTAFPAFGDAEVKNILAYIKQANSAPVAAPAAEGGAAVEAQDTGGGQFFNIVLVVLLVIMALVLVALLAVLNLLTRLSTPEGGEEYKSPMDALKANLKGLASDNTIRTAAVWLFIILATKASLDGMFKIGVHQGYAPQQPINFSHKLHAGDMAINCAYCHTGVYKGKQSGIPSSSICMNCHNTIKKESPEIQKIYAAIEKNQPVEWVRVHNLPDLAYFNHSQHTQVAGLDCANCHGDIAKMEVVEQRTTLTMGWCIDCHRKTDVNAKGNAYYDAILTAHNKTSKETMKVEDIGGLECAKCHY